MNVQSAEILKLDRHAEVMEERLCQVVSLFKKGKVYRPSDFKNIPGVQANEFAFMQCVTELIKDGTIKDDNNNGLITWVRV